MTEVVVWLSQAAIAQASSSEIVISKNTTYIIFIVEKTNKQ